MADLAALFAATFLAATLVPLPSEAALFAYVAVHPERVALAVATATVGNTAGGMTCYVLGRFIPQKDFDPRALALLRRWGAPATLLGWLPVIGEAICIAAGWLRIHHISWWTRDHGPTDLDNGIPLCPCHHTCVHEGRFTLQRELTTGQITFWRPDGTQILPTNPNTALFDIG